MLNPFTAMINFEFFIYVQRKKWNKTIASSVELMAAKRKQNLKKVARRKLENTARIKSEHTS